MIVLAFPFLLEACTGKQKEEKREDIPVKSMTVGDDRIGANNRYIGTIVESESSELSFEVSGNVKQVLVSEGDKVKKGQLLAVLRQGNIANNYSEISAALKQAKDSYERMSLLYKNNSIPEIRYIDAKTQYERAKAAEGAASKNLRDCRLFSPYSGVIGQRSIDPGNNISAGYPAFKILNTAHLKVKISVPETEIGNLRLGMETEVLIKALKDMKLKGVISRKGIEGNLLSHTYEVRINLATPPRSVLPGMLCEVSSFPSSKSRQIIIPLSSVQLYENNRHYVWKIIHHKTYLREISTGPFADDGVVVKDGLFPGDRIITEGFQKIAEGATVKY